YSRNFSVQEGRSDHEYSVSLGILGEIFGDLSPKRFSAHHRQPRLFMTGLSRRPIVMMKGLESHRFEIFLKGLPFHESPVALPIPTFLRAPWIGRKENAAGPQGRP